ncbi:MAG: NAD(P)/FAD-dependent oxidoreductase [Acholeplasmataceae bacterium]
MTDIIIIGAGPAGIYAGFLAKSQHLSSLIIEASNEIGGKMTQYADKPIYDMPGHKGILSKDLLNDMYEQYNSHDHEGDIKFYHQVKEIKGSYPHIEVVTDQGTYETKTVLLANGGGMFTPRTLGLDDEQTLKNLHYHVEKGVDHKGERIVVFGGGDSALDWANFFADQGADVTLVHRRDEFRGHYDQVDHIKTKGLVMTPYRLHAVERNIDTILNVMLKHTKTKELTDIKADHYYVFYGHVPARDVHMFVDIDKNDQGILVTSAMETTKHGVFAVGNSVSYHGKVNMIITGLGETATAIGSIVKLLHPERTMNKYQ